jgi:hypothetical protein
MFANRVDELSVKGHMSFTLDQVGVLRPLSPPAIKAAIGRLQKKRQIAVPYRGGLAHNIDT